MPSDDIQYTLLSWDPRRMEWLEMVRETGLTTGSCTGEENIGAEVVNDHTCEANSAHYKTPTKRFICFQIGGKTKGSWKYKKSNRNNQIHVY